MRPCIILAIAIHNPNMNDSAIDGRMSITCAVSALNFREISIVVEVATFLREQRKMKLHRGRFDPVSLLESLRPFPLSVRTE